MGSPNELLEREDELARITALLDASIAGEGGLLAVEGEAGAGKTSLLRAAATAAAEREMTVLRARGGEYERDFPHGVIRQLFEPALRDPSRKEELLSGSAALAGPVFEPGAEVAEGGAVEHGLYWLTADLAASAPLLLVVDDAQWADIASLQALAYIGRRLDGLAVAMAIAVRSGEPGVHDELLDELRREAVGPPIEPSPLTPEATAVLVAGETGKGTTPRFAEACRAATAGNPFLLAELARALDSDEIGHGEEDIECLTRAAAAGVASSIRARLARLGARAIDVAKAVAVLEPNAEQHLIAALADLPQADVMGVSELLVEARLLVDTPTLSFAHPLVRDAVLAEVPGPRLAALHADAARLLRDANAEADTVAAHLLLAEPAGDDWVVAELRAAASAALGRGAAGAAVRYLRRALREPPSRDDRLGVSRELGVALLTANDPEGIEVLRTVRAATADPELRAAIANDLAGSLGLRNGNEEAAELLEESLAEVPAAGEELAQYLRGWLLLQPIWGLERVPEGALSSVVPSPQTLEGRFVRQMLGLLLALGLGPMEKACRMAEPTIEEKRYLREDALAGLPPQGSLVALTLADRGDRVAGLFELALEGARRRGVMPGIGGGYGVRALCHYLEGDLREAQADAEISIDVLRPFGLVTPLAQWSAVAANVLIARGEFAAAERLLEEPWGGRERVPGSPGAVLLCARGEARRGLGRHAEARHDFLAAAERISWLPFANPEVYFWRGGLARCEAALGNAEEARALAAEAVALAREANGPRALGIALRTEGLVAGGKDGLALLEEAARTLSGTRARLHYAEALLEHGAALRRANFRKDAREPLREALELAHRCGATATEERARTELAATGARPRKAVFTGVDSLTPSELRVARMAAEGMTNREIAQALTVTAKTVETHMRHVFQKLDVAGRGELPATLKS